MEKETPLPPKKKRPYQKPAVTFREPLEAIAAVCTPAPFAKGTPLACASGPISS